MSLASTRNARPIREGGRTIGWWGAVIGLIALAHLVGAAHVAAVYLRAASGAWPPTAGDAPDVVISGVAAGLAVLAAVCAVFADRRYRDAKPLGLPALILGSLLALGAAGIRGAVTIFSDHPVADHAYWSVRFFLGGLDVLLLSTVAIYLAVCAVHTVRGLIRTGTHADLAPAWLWSAVTALFVVGSWVVQYALVYWW